MKRVRSAGTLGDMIGNRRRSRGRPLAIALRTPEQAYEQGRKDFDDRRSAAGRPYATVENNEAWRRGYESRREETRQ